MTDFSFINAFTGGTLIGLAVVLMFLGNGRITGISGIVGGMVKPEKKSDQLAPGIYSQPDRGWFTLSLALGTGSGR